jgi:hypothetical protein
MLFGRENLIRFCIILQFSSFIQKHIKSSKVFQLNLTGTNRIKGDEDSEMERKCKQLSSFSPLIEFSLLSEEAFTLDADG